MIGVIFLVVLLLPETGFAQRTGKLPAIYDDAGLDEQLGATLPMDLPLRDERGEAVTLRSLIPENRPVLLNFVYFDCPMLCSILLDGVTKSLQQLVWTPGDEFEVVTVSFASDEGPDLAARQKDRFVSRLDRPQAAGGWHFLTGEEPAIRELTAAAGFQFKWVEEQQEYVHPAAILFVSPEGRITRYLHGIEFSPRDVRTALVEASEGRVGSVLDQVVLYCFRYDPQSGSYVPYAMNIMKLGGALTLLVLGTALFFFWRRESSRLADAEKMTAANYSHTGSTV